MGRLPPLPPRRRAAAAVGTTAKIFKLNPSFRARREAETNERERERRDRSWERERVCGVVVVVGAGDSFPNGDKYFAFGLSRRRVRRIFIVSRRAEWGREGMRERGRAFVMQRHMHARHGTLALGDSAHLRGMGRRGAPPKWNVLFPLTKWARDFTVSMMHFSRM